MKTFFDRSRAGRHATLGLGLALLAGAASAAASAPAFGAQVRTVRLLTHDSFLLPDVVIEAFEDQHGARLEVFRQGDAGAMVNQAILTRIAGDEPIADVLYGVDNTFLSRAVEAGIFEPYRSSEADTVAVNENLLLRLGAVHVSTELRVAIAQPPRPAFAIRHPAPRPAGLASGTAPIG